MAVTFNDAWRNLAHLIERVNLDRIGVEIDSKHGSAVLMSKDEYITLGKSARLLRIT